jgi:hypothetical protein
VNAQQAAQGLLMYAVLPLWVLAGLVDWACHRRTRIEATSGRVENAFHWLLIGEMGVAVLAVALLEVTAAVLLLVAAAWLLHECTTWVELRYAVPRREVRPFEQMVHSFLELLPLVALGLLCVMRWDQVLAPDFGLRWKEPAWPVAYLAAAGGAVVVFNLLPLAEESWRCWRRGGGERWGR